MPEIRGLPEIKDYPGANPLRIKTLQALRLMASDPTSLEVMPLGGMVKALKGKTVYHGFRPPYYQEMRFSDAMNIARAQLVQKFGEDWVLKSPAGTLLRQTELVKKQARKAATRRHMFKKFDENLAGSGAGGNLYGEGIYISEHPKISSGYGPAVRKHNLLPQAKILDIDQKLSPAQLDKVQEIKASRYVNIYQPDVERWKKAFRKKFPDGASLNELYLNRGEYKQVVTGLGYDGLQYDAGRVMGLPEGVPEGTKNWVIFNYDVINNPRKVAIERGFKKAKE